MRFGEAAARSAGHVTFVLPVLGDAGYAVADRRIFGSARPIVLAVACSGNAHVTANVRFDQPIASEAGLPAHVAELTAVLNDVLDSLRP